VLYDAWAAYDDVTETFLLGKTVGDFTCGFTGLSTPENVGPAREEAISYAAYRILSHRFGNSPGAEEALGRFDALLAELGYDKGFTSTDYASGDPAALGNYLGQCMIDFGLQDGANETGGYTNQHYVPSNTPLVPNLPGNESILNFNFWQPLSFDVFIDQSGNITQTAPEFVSPEWGDVVPFALSAEHKTIYQRDGHTYNVYHDPGPPPYFSFTDRGADLPNDYKWGFVLVVIWSSHLDPTDGVLWDISPASIGNIPDLPATLEEYPSFYDLLDGGDSSQGRHVSPFGQPYEPQLVPRADYVRVLAEFWADGPDSETPPGHWFTILNYVSDHPLLQKRFKGEGPILDDLEWDVKSYFILGGAMHDAAVSAWGIKGWYDYIRPISAIRGMADKGQSSDGNLTNYNPDGIPLVDGYIEVVKDGDALAGAEGKNLGKIKVLAWRGPDFIDDPETDEAGVGWILAENWWPYQRPTFVTPPFAGYVSGHSTYSRAAAEVLTLFTGDEYFPGGVGEFVAKKNEFLVFEEGPSVDVTLQWATYRDASDQTSLSRIWGGIHPPVDDIPGRLIGRQIGIDAFNFGAAYFPELGPPNVDFNGDDVVDFDDFFMFAQNFGKSAEGDSAKYDLNSDGTVNFGDFFLFAENFNTAN